MSAQDAASAPTIAEAVFDLSPRQAGAAICGAAGTRRSVGDRAVLYCSLRSVTWLKTVVSGLMVGVGGLAGWAAVAPITLGAVPFFLFLALWEIGGRNLRNDLADLAADRAVGLTTVATIFGARVSAIATACVAAATLIALALLRQPLVVTLVSLGLGVWAMGLPAVRLLRTPTSERAGGAVF